MKRHMQRHQAGDTIVEVLIAISIVSVVLVGAFAVANNSTKSVQDNNEHTEAQQHLQSQIEALRVYAATPDATLPADGPTYCMTSGGPKSITDPSCTVVTIGGTTAKPEFTRSVNDTYTFTIRWDSLKSGVAQEQFVYRLHQT